MKASEFYTLAYNEAGKTNATGRAVIMRGASALIDASHAYESGKITKRKFESLERQVWTEGMDAIQKQNAAQSQVRAAQWRHESAVINSALTPNQNNYAQPASWSISPNVFGGQNWTSSTGQMVTCSPNVFGGQNCR